MGAFVAPIVASAGGAAAGGGLVSALGTAASAVSAISTLSSVFGGSEDRSLPSPPTAAPLPEAPTIEQTPAPDTAAQAELDNQRQESLARRRRSAAQESTIGKINDENPATRQTTLLGG
jgi:hypothetical protein